MTHIPHRVFLRVPFCRPGRIAASILALMAVLAPLGACVTEPPAASLPQLTFSHLAPIVLKVAQVEVANDYAAPLQAPHIEHVVPAAPEAALRSWAAHRLSAAGGTGVARLVIKTASVTAVPLKVTPGLKGAFTKDQSERYEAVVRAELHIYEGGGSGTGYVAAEASHSRTVAENASVNDRRRVQFELIEVLMADFDREMEKNIRTHLGRWLK